MCISSDKNYFKLLKLQQDSCTVTVHSNKLMLPYPVDHPLALRFHLEHFKFCLNAVIKMLNV